jgi:hypothetical protein
LGSSPSGAEPRLAVTNRFSSNSRIWEGSPRVSRATLEPNHDVCELRVGAQPTDDARHARCRRSEWLGRSGRVVRNDHARVSALEDLRLHYTHVVADRQRTVGMIRDGDAAVRDELDGRLLDRWGRTRAPLEDTATPRANEVCRPTASPRSPAPRARTTQGDRLTTQLASSPPLDRRSGATSRQQQRDGGEGLKSTHRTRTYIRLEPPSNRCRADES